MANGAPREHYETYVMCKECGYETFDCSTTTRRLRGNLTCGGLTNLEQMHHLSRQKTVVATALIAHRRQLRMTQMN